MLLGVSTPERDSTPPAGDDPYAAMRNETDPRALRALAHPTRIALLEALAVGGPLTATEAAGIVGGTVPNVSYHLRTLAKYEYVVEAGGGTGRERPWKLGAVSLRIDSENPDLTVGHAARALGDVVLDRWWARVRHYDSHREQYPQAVRSVSGQSQFVLFATTAEVEQAQREIASVLMRFTDRIDDPAARPEGSVPFEVLTATHPFEVLLPTEPER